MTRVLFDAHQLGRRQTGNETYVRELLSSLVDQPDLELIAAVEKGGASALRGNLRSRRVPRNGLLRLTALALLARSLRADIVHAIYFLPPGTGRPTVLTVHDISFELYPELFPPGDLFRDKALIRASARAASTVITVSETSRREIIERYGLKDEQVIAIPNGVSPAFVPSDDWAAFGGDRPLRVLAVGTLQPRKNLTRLLEAVQVVAKDVPVSLRVVGPDGYMSGQIRVAAGVGDVKFLGWASEDALAREYRAADVFVYPSLYEGFGLPVVEAMASGTPVVASTGGAIPETAGDAACLVDPYDVNALAGAIRGIAESGSLAAELRRRGLQRARAFSWQASASAHAAAYRTLVI